MAEDVQISDDGSLVDSSGKQLLTNPDARSRLADALSGAFAPLDAGRQGTGSPEGVVSAPVGTVYRDLAATNGAVLWVKASGTGNTGWRVMWGDTGWRQVIAWDASGNITEGSLNADFAPLPGSAGWVRVRRTAAETMIAIRNLGVATAGTSSGIYVMPVGFQSTSPSIALAAPAHVRDLTTGQPPSLLMLSGVVRRPSDISWTTAVKFTETLAVWPAQDAWPTTLPGSAV